MKRKSHPKKEIEKALKYAEKNGWRIEGGGSSAHAWGKLFCPYNDKDCRCGERCVTSVWSTPRSPENHGKQICKVVDGCSTHQKKKILIKRRIE